MLSQNQTQNQESTFRPAHNASNPILQAALKYLAEGCSIIPIKCQTKEPALTSWKQYQKHRPTINEIKGWFQDGNGIAIVTGKVSNNLCIIDFDGEAWMSIANQFLQNFPFLQFTRMVGTGSQRLHLWFKTEELPENLTKLVRTFPGGEIEFRCANHYTLCPPSLHPSGRRYTFVNPDVPIAKISIEQLQAILRWFTIGNQESEGIHESIGEKIPSFKSQDAGGCLKESLKMAYPGIRNQEGFRLARKLRDLGLSYTDAGPILILFAKGVPKGDHRYTPREAVSSLRQVYGKRPTKTNSNEYLLYALKEPYKKYSSLEHSCSHGHKLLIPKIGTKGYFMPYYAKMWNCPTCVSYLAQREVEDILINFPDGVHYRVLTYEGRKPLKYNRLVKEIREKKGVYYACVSFKENLTLILSNISFEDSQLCDWNDPVASKLLHRFVDVEPTSLNGRSKIRHSKSFRRCKGKAPKRTDDFLVMDIFGKVDDFQAHLEMQGSKLEKGKDKHFLGVDFSEESLKFYREALSQGVQYMHCMSGPEGRSFMFQGHRN